MRAVPTVFLGVMYDIQEAAASETHRNDVLTLQYLALDHSKPWSRIIVASFYVLGFGLLLIPTVITFVRVIKSIV